MVAETVEHAKILIVPEPRVACALHHSKGISGVKRRCDNQACNEIDWTHVDGVVDVRIGRQLDTA